MAQLSNGGWGWVCVSACAAMGFLLQGLTISFSVLFLAMRQHFNSSAAATAWVYGIYHTMARLAGPVSGALCRKFGVWTCVLLAGLVKTCSLILAGYSPCLLFAYLSFSLFGGFAASVMITSTFIVVDQYFSEQRSRATAVALAGRGLGIVVFAPAVEFLLHQYGYCGAMLLLGGAFLNVVPAALLLKLPLVVRKFEGHGDAEEATGQVVARRTQGETGDQKVNQALPGDTATLCSSEEKTGSSSAGLDELEPVDADECGAKDKKAVQLCSCFSGRATCSATTGPQKATKPLQKKSSWNVLDLHLLRQPNFVTYAVHLMFTITGGSVCSIYAAALGREVGITGGQMALTLSLLGGVSLFARLISGVIFDERRVGLYRVHVYAALLLLSASVLITTTFIGGMATFATLVLTFGSVYAMLVTQETVVLTDLVPREVFCSAVGLSMPFRGVGLLLGATLSGLLVDATGSFRNCYLLAAGFFVLAFLAIEPYELYRHRRDTHEQGQLNA